MSREFTLDAWRARRAATAPALLAVVDGARMQRRRNRDDEARDMLIRATAALVRQWEASGRLRRTGGRAYEIVPR